MCVWLDRLIIYYKVFKAKSKLMIKQLFSFICLESLLAK